MCAMTFVQGKTTSSDRAGSWTNVLHVTVARAGKLLVPYRCVRGIRNARIYWLTTTSVVPNARMKMVSTVLILHCFRRNFAYLVEDPPRRRNSKIPWPLQWANNEEYSQSKMFSKCLSIVVLIIRIWFIPSSQFPMCFWYCESPFFILVIMLAAEITVKYALRWLKFISWATNLKLEWVRPKGILTNQ